MSICSTVSMILVHRYRPLLQKVAKCKKYNKFKDFAFNTLAFQKVTNMTFKYSNFRALKSVNPKSSGGSAPAPRQGPYGGPLDPTQNWLALTRSLCALRAHVCPPKKKSARAYALAMCAPRTCLAKKNRTPAIQKNRLALRARYVRYAHMFAPP